MASPHPAPDEIKWKIAANMLSALPILYDVCFRDVVGEEYDRIEEQIWISLAEETAKVAESLNLPTGNAEDLVLTLDLIQTILFGPDMRSEQIKITSERSVLVMKKCMFEKAATRTRIEGDCIFHRCMVFYIALVKAMNPDYTLRFVRSMCMGDGHCEMKVMKSEEAAEEV